MMDKLRVAGFELCGAVAEEEKADVEQRITAVEGNWATVTDICAQKHVYGTLLK